MTHVLAPHPCVVAGLDVGGTGMKGTIIDADGTVLHRRNWVTPRQEGPDAVVQAVLDALAALVAMDPRVSAAGLVVPGAVDDLAGVAEWSENVGWRNVPFRRLAAERIGLPIGFSHDVRAGALAERVAGAAQGEDNVLFMPLGTGISGTITVDGFTVTGPYACEIGHLNVGSGLPCACGAVGCLETVSTGPSIARAYRERTGRDLDGARPVFEAAALGDPDAAAVVANAVDALAQALTAYVTLLDPHLVVIGGGLAMAGEQLLQPLREALAGKLVWQRMPRVVGAAFGGAAASIGACLLAREACAPTPSAQTPGSVSASLPSEETPHA